MMSSSGAAQAAGATANSATVHVGCFNMGVDQNMLGCPKHIKNMRRIIRKAVKEGDLQLLGLCEVGGHKKRVARGPHLTGPLDP